MPDQDSLTVIGVGLILDQETGALVSRATVVADPLPVGLRIIERATDIDHDTERWDEATRRVVPFVNVERAAELAAQADALIAEAQALDPTVKGRAV